MSTSIREREQNESMGEWNKKKANQLPKERLKEQQKRRKSKE